jgi:serine/threonine protein kinase/TPR repeat protein
MPDELFPDDLDFGQTIQIPRFGAGQKIFRRYILKKILGRGGMGVVWLAEDEDLEWLVALKVLPETLCHDRDSLEALKYGARLGLHLAHPNIVQTYDFLRDDDAAAISMEYVDGATFSEVRTTKPTHVFDPADLHTYIEALCDALHYAHNRERIVHRDLKPRNLMLNSQGDLKIADFGISRTISDSMIVLTGKVGTTGSPHISPQQWDGEPPTPLDDIYSVGATLYELLSSKPPFIGVVDWRQVHHKIPPAISKRRAELGITGAAPIPAEWEETIAACLAKSPKDRPQTMRDLQARLTINGQMPVAASETSASPVVSAGPEVAKPVDSSEEDFFDEDTPKDLTHDTIDTATVRVEPKLDAPTAPVEGPSTPVSEPILKKLDDAVQDQVTPQYVSTARAEPKLDIPTAPVERSVPPVSEPILDKLGGPVKEEVTTQHVSTARAESKLDAPTAPAKGPSAPASGPILDKPDSPVKEEVTTQHVSETLNKISEPASDAGAPPTRRTAESAPPLGPLVSPVDSPDVFSPEKAAPANGDVAFPSTEVARPDRPQVIRPRLGKVPRWVWVAAMAAILILGAIVIAIVKPKPPHPPPAPQVADLRVESEPSGANLTLDGSPPIKTPHTFKDLKFGRHRLTITLDGYSPVERDIEFSGASPPKIVLPPIEEIAKLSVRSDPLGASIRLDGTLPQEPNTFRNVKFGEHRLTATMEGFEPKEQLLVVSKDTSSEIILKLPPFRDPLQPLFDELKDAEAAYDWKTYQVVSLQLIDQLMSPGGPASNKNREKLTEVFEKLLTEGRKRNKERAARVSVKSLLLTSEEFRAHEKNLKSAARLDIVPAILIVADELRERKPTILGKVVQGDPEALNWYYYAAEKKNNIYAMTRIGWIYWWGECGQQVDKRQAFEWFKRASDAGDAEASTTVGESYLRGVGTPKDEDEGIRRLLPLTEKGWARAKNLIGQCYYNGLGQFGKLSQDERNRKAKSLYEEAILADDWEACGHLGVMYEAGQGVPKDWRQAARLYLQGVEHENPICMYYYAQALENHGPELLKMLDREDDAETYYVKAAAAGVMEARQWCLEHKVKWSNPTPTPTPTATPLSP